jgi:hypothetical protein
MQLKPLLFLMAITGVVLVFSACPKKKGNSSSMPTITGGTTAVIKDGHSDPKLVGDWTAKDGSKLKITAKTFFSPDSEDYFVKGDTIYTSFEGNLPYTKYAIKKLDEHNLELFTPDSVTVGYTK